MDSSCLIYGGAISLVVSFLKRWPWAANNPKIIAALLSAALGVYNVFGHGAAVSGGAVQALVMCVITQLTAAVGAHEMIVQPATDAIRAKLFNA